MTRKVLVIDIFCGPSHNHLLKYLEQFDQDIDLIKLPAKKWPWMARTGALQCLSQLPANLSDYR